MQGERVQVQVRVGRDPLPLYHNFLVRDPRHAGHDRVQPERLLHHHAEVLHLGQVLGRAWTVCKYVIHLVP